MSLARTLNNQALVNDNGKEVLTLIVRYAKTWRLLLQYDENGLAVPEGCKPSQGALVYAKAIAAVGQIKGFKSPLTPFFSKWGTS